MQVPAPLSPQDTTIVLVDYVVGFANIIRSHDVPEHLNAAVALAKTAVLYESGLVVTTGAPDKPYGPYYPEILDLIGDHPVIARQSAFNSFDDETFAAAVRETGRKRLAIAGIATEGCVLQTVLGAARLGYEPYVVVDASASVSKQGHDAAIQRMAMYGIAPVTWGTLAAEFQLDPGFAENATVRPKLTADHVPSMAMAARAFFAARELEPLGGAR